MHSLLIKGTSRPIETAAVDTGETRNHRTSFENQISTLISSMNFVQLSSLPPFKWGLYTGGNHGSHGSESAWLTAYTL